MIKIYNNFFEVKNLKYEYNGIKTLDDFSLKLSEGEILAIIGDIEYDTETFFDFLNNKQSNFNGKIIFKDETDKISKQIKTDEISMLLLKSTLIETMTISENLYLKKFPKKKIISFINWKEIKINSNKWLKKLKINVDIKKIVKELTSGEKKLIRIAKILISEPDIAILHNPTDDLSASMIQNLYNVLFDYKDEGRSIIYITNNWEEALKVSDRIVVLFEGKNIGELLTAEAKKNPQKLLRLLENNDYMRRPSEIEEETKLLLDSVLKAAEFISSGYELKDVLLLLSQHASKTMKADSCTIHLIDEGTESIIDSFIFKQNKKFVGDLKKEKLIKISKNEKLFYSNKHEKEFVDFFVELNEIRTIILIPIFIRSNVTGILQLNFEKYFIYSEEEALFLTAFAKQAAIAIEDTRLMGRSALLQESHHRIKNSLQAVINLIIMQKKASVDNKEFNLQESFDNVISRVKSIATVHDLLSKEKLGRSIINLKDIIEAISKNSFLCDKNIEIKLDIENIMIPYNKATSIALIINELISNCYKHAFKNMNSGEILIECRKYSKEIVLTIEDNGVGVEVEKIKKSSSLGSTIINSIVSYEFKGSILYENLEQGIRIKIKIPIEKIFKE